MAGIIMNLGGEEPLERYRRCGAYSTRIQRKAYSARGWGRAHEATIADYLAMRPGDQVFLFRRRMLYGVGRVVQLSGGPRAALCNYPHSWDLQRPPERSALWGNEPGEIVNHPFVLFFEPWPFWYVEGVDMDEALAADTHGYVSSLPFFSGVSFIRIDDFEAAHLVNLIARRNRGTKPVTSEHQRYHDLARETLAEAPDSYHIDVDALVRQYSADQRVRHEALLEAWVGDALTNQWEFVKGAFGREAPWSFVGRQVPASPFKPPEYVDRIDILAYDIGVPIPGLTIPSPHSYVVVEFKKDEATTDDVRQTMKYVDWIAHKKQGGEYEGVSAALVAAAFSDDLHEVDFTRSYVKPRRPYDVGTWEGLRLIKYEVTECGPALSLTPLTPPG